MPQVVSAVCYLAQMGVVHCDIKDENVMVSPELRVTLLDFGSAVVEDGRPGREFRGSESFASPEVAARLASGNLVYCFQAQEVWALGVSIHLHFVTALGAKTDFPGIVYCPLDSMDTGGRCCCTWR